MPLKSSKRLNCCSPASFSVCGHQVVDDRLGVDLLLDVDRHHGDGQVLAVLLVLAVPHELRVERRVAGVEHRLRGLLIVGDEVAQLLGGDVRPLVLVADRLDLGLGGRFLPGHQGFDSCWLDQKSSGSQIVQAGSPDILGRDRPDHVELHFVVAMDDPVPRADDLAPWDLASELAETRGKTLWPASPITRNSHEPPRTGTVRRGRGPPVTYPPTNRLNRRHDNDDVEALMQGSAYP